MSGAAEGHREAPPGTVPRPERSEGGGAVPGSRRSKEGSEPGTVPRQEEPGTVPGAPAAFAGAEATAFSGLRALYREFDEATARVAPVCRASGRCCDFEAYGHTLFASRLEVDLLLADAGLDSFNPATKLCPFWQDRKCAARGPRPLGCRAFFCDTGKEEAMGVLHEAHLRRVKDLHDRHGIPWRYAPLLRHLADALPRPPADALPRPPADALPRPSAGALPRPPADALPRGD